MSARQHGRDCLKAPHRGSGYLHAEDDDRPFDIDGVQYCGRCHGWIGEPVVNSEETMSNHSRTPWEVHDHAPYSVWSGDTQVATCRVLLDDGNWDGYFPKTSDEVKANARLIASAPDLLDALKGMIGLIQLIQAREPALVTNHRFIAAEVAIARAEGRDV